MKSTIRAVVALAALLIPVPAREARGEDAAGVLACVQERYRPLADLAARFVQESRVASLGRPRRREGTIVFQAPGKMRWEYAPPDAQLIVADGTTLWFYRPDRKQVIAQKLDAAFARQTPLLFLLGRGDFGEEFTWREGALSRSSDGTYAVALRPKIETPDLVRLVLEVVPGECRLAGTVLEDAFGNVTRLTFAEERADVGVDAGLFHFSVPPGTEVVRP